MGEQVSKTKIYSESQEDPLASLTCSRAGNVVILVIEVECNTAKLLVFFLE